MNDVFNLKTDFVNHFPGEGRHSVADHVRTDYLLPGSPTNSSILPIDFVAAVDGADRQLCGLMLAQSRGPGAGRP
jgi:hypothetical protein